MCVFPVYAHVVCVCGFRMYEVVFTPVYACANMCSEVADTPCGKKQIELLMLIKSCGKNRISVFFPEKNPLGSKFEFESVE